MNKLVLIYKEFYREIKPWLKLTGTWFLAATIIGGLTFFFIPDLLEGIFQVFEDKFADVPPLSSQMAWMIFLNNLQASAIGLIGGLLIGLGPFLVVATNGFMLGYVIVAVTILSRGNELQSLGFLFLGLVPHGIIEIPVFILAAAVGLKLGTEWLKKENYGQRLKVLWKNIKLTLWGIPIVVIMLAIAAIIEVFVTGNILEKIN